MQEGAVYGAALGRMRGAGVAEVYFAGFGERHRELAGVVEFYFDVVAVELGYLHILVTGKYGATFVL